MKALAASRRHRFAPAVLVLLALLLTGAIYAVAAPERATAAAGGSDLDEGERLFQANCATCHGANAEGTDVAPSLIGVGAASVHFQMSTGRMPLTQNMQQAPPKPTEFTEEQIGDIAAWVASLAPGPRIPTAEQVDPELGNPARGSELFRTNCAMCHNAVGAGGALTEGKEAPSLLDRTPTQIYEAMETGPTAMPVFNDANLSPEDKRDIIAYLDQQAGEQAAVFQLGSLGPVSEGLWAWIIGIGALIGATIWMGAKSS